MESELLNDAIVGLQAEIGVDSGDVAGLFFSDMHTQTYSEMSRQDIDDIVFRYTN